jgi:GT2 family glycosyltransferase
MPVSFSFIVPFHRNLDCLADSLAALVPLPPRSELIVAVDGAEEDCRPIASAHGARIVVIDGTAGPAVARNEAAAIARGDVLVFIDADVVVSREGLERMIHLFHERPHMVAVFGSYDESPADPGFMSQYKNLSHAFIHQASATDARTFWTGFGAVRRDAFLEVGGFDERFDRPSVEDIDLGYRLVRSGREIILDPALSACHLKRWTFWSVMLSDVRDRGIPWTQLILRYRELSGHLNLQSRYRWSTFLAYVALMSVAIGAHDRRVLADLPLLAVGLTVLNRDYYRFFYRKRGGSFVVRAWLMHTLHHLYNGLSFAIGTALFCVARFSGLKVPGALAADSWSAGRSRSAPAVTFARRIRRRKDVDTAAAPIGRIDVPETSNAARPPRVAAHAR